MIGIELRLLLFLDGFLTWISLNVMNTWLLFKSMLKRACMGM